MSLLQNALKKLDGVDNVCVDMARGSVEVIYNSPANPIEIKKCIENTGHPVYQNLKIKFLQIEYNLI